MGDATMTSEIVKIDKDTYVCDTGVKVNVMNTDWPVEHFVRRSGSGWTLHRRVVNGICQGGAVHFRTLKSAMEACE